MLPNPEAPEQPELVIETAALADAPQLASIFFNAFSDPYFQSLFPPTDAVRAYITSSYEGIITGKAQESRVFVVRNARGCVVSAAHYWIIRPGSGGCAAWRERWGEPVEEMDEAALDEFFEGMARQHHLVLGEKEHIYLETIMTHEDYQKRGYATKILEAGVTLADEMDYPLYLDAEKDAKSLYEKAGYVEQTGVEITSPLAPMLRLRKSDRASQA